MLKENENELVIFQFKSLNYCCKPNRKNACILFWLLGFLYNLNKTNAPICLSLCRPSCFPPSYEESQGSQVYPNAAEFVVVVDGVDVVMSLAPPLYSQDSSEAPDCTWSWEQPPRYSQVECIQQGEVDADEQLEALSGH